MYLLNKFSETAFTYLTYKMNICHIAQPFQLRSDQERKLNILRHCTSYLEQHTQIPFAGVSQILFYKSTNLVAKIKSTNLVAKIMLIISASELFLKVTTYHGLTIYLPGGEVTTSLSKLCRNPSGRVHIQNELRFSDNKILHNYTNIQVVLERLCKVTILHMILLQLVRLY